MEFHDLGKHCSSEHCRRQGANESPPSLPLSNSQVYSRPLLMPTAPEFLGGRVELIMSMKPPMC